MAYNNKQKSKAYRKKASDFQELAQFLNNTVEDVSFTETVTSVADNHSVTSEQQGDVAAFHQSNEVDSSDLSPIKTPVQAESVIMSNAAQNTTPTASDMAAVAALFQLMQNMGAAGAASSPAAPTAEQQELAQLRTQVAALTNQPAALTPEQQQIKDLKEQVALLLQTRGQTPVPTPVPVLAHRVHAAPQQHEVLTAGEFLAAVKNLPAPVVNVTPSYGGGFSHRDDSFFSQVREMDAAELIGTAIGATLVGGAAVVGGMWIYDKFIKS